MEKIKLYQAYGLLVKRHVPQFTEQTGNVIKCITDSEAYLIHSKLFRNAFTAINNRFLH